MLSTGTEVGPLDVLFDAGIANELFPLLLFVGIGAMIDFTPLLSNPKLMIFGAAAHLAEVAERFWRNPLRCGQLFPLPPHPVVKHQQRFAARHREPAVVVVFHRHLFCQE